MSFVDACLSNGFLVSPSLKGRSDIDESSFMNFISGLSEKPLVIDESLISKFEESKKNFFNNNIKSSVKVDVVLPAFREHSSSSVSVVKSYNFFNKTRSMADWFSYYNNRYNSMKKLLEHRSELRGSASITSILKMSGRNQVSTIALVKDIKKTHNNNYILELEDPTGLLTAIVSVEKENLSKVIEDVVLDEVIGIVGSASNKRMFVSEIVFPEVPEREVIASPVDEYACFIADTHVGSINFEKEMYERFTSWLKGTSGDAEQREAAKKVKYLVVAGDLVDGIGIYPGQEKELEISDIYKQYETFADYFKGLPSDIQLIFIPGNHDSLRQSEPQPPLFNDIAKPVLELSNVYNLSNPSTVNIGAVDNFKGLNMLMYHGLSYTYYATKVAKLVMSGMDKPDSVSEFLLRKRHLGPTHESGLITPDNFDPLIIDSVPDVLVTGHIHRLGHRRYKATNIVAASCFQKMTTYMQKLGHHPTPGYAPLLNLKTRNIKVMNFT